MAQPPSLPGFEKSKVPTTLQPAVEWLWGLFQDFFKRTSQALQRGLTVKENLAGGWLDIPVPAGASFPLQEMANPLPSGQRIHGVLVAGVFSQASPGTRVLTGASVETVPDMDLGVGGAPIGLAAEEPGVGTLWPVIGNGDGFTVHIDEYEVALPAVGVTVEWTTGASGGLVVLGVTGLPSGVAVTVRVLVLAE